MFKDMLPTFLVVISFLDDAGDKGTMKVTVSASSKNVARSIAIQELFDRDPENVFLSARVTDHEFIPHISETDFKKEMFEKWKIQNSPVAQ